MLATSSTVIAPTASSTATGRRRVSEAIRSSSLSVMAALRPCARRRRRGRAAAGCGTSARSTLIPASASRPTYVSGGW